jgi:hypothetical protein
LQSLLDDVGSFMRGPGGGRRESQTLDAGDVCRIHVFLERQGHAMSPIRRIA